MMPLTRREIDDVVVGARRVRVAVDAAVDADGPVRLLVVGPRGSAKSAVLRRLARDAADLGRPVATLGPGVDADGIDRSVLLVVDDLDTRDAATLDALVRRAADTAAGLVVATRGTTRRDAAARVGELLEATRPALVLGQVSRADVLDHLGEDDVLAPACLDWLLEATGGGAWLVGAALAAHDDRDCADDPCHRELERLLSVVIAHRLSAVDDEVRFAVEHACADLEAVAAHEAVERAHAEGLLRRDGRPVPLVRSAVASGLTPRGLAERAAAAYRAGDLDAASFLVDQAVAHPGDDASALATAVAAATWSARGMLAIAHRLSEGTDGASAVIAAVGTGIALDATPRATVPSTGGVAVDLLREGLRTSLRAATADASVATLARASQLFTAARVAEPFAELPAVVAAAAAQSHGDLAGARAVLDAAIAGGQGGAVATPRLLLWRAWIAMHQVRSRDAREALAAATAAAAGFTPRDEVLAHAVRLGLARRYGDAASLAAAWEAARPALHAVDIDLFLLQPLTEFLAAAAKLHEDDAVEPAIAQAIDVVRRLGEPSLWSLPLRWAGVQRSVLANDPASLAPHAHALSVASTTYPVAATMASAGRTWTAVLGGTVDADDVEAAALALAALGLTWDAARLAGVAAKVTDDRRTAARLLSRAREIHPLDAARALPQPQTETTAPTPQAAPSGLSPREVDVARLVVEGKTYAEIGAAIFISPRTAEHHIASIRRRLGAASRSDLIAKLRAALASDALAHQAVAG